MCVYAIQLEGTCPCSSDYVDKLSNYRGMSFIGCKFINTVISVNIVSYIIQYIFGRAFFSLCLYAE